MSTLDEWEHRRRPYRGPKRAQKRPSSRAVKTQMRLFAEAPKKAAPPNDNGAPFNDDIPF